MENEPLIIVRYKDADLILNLMYKKKVGSSQQTPSQKLASFVYIALMFKVLNYSKMWTLSMTVLQNCINLHENSGLLPMKNHSL